MDQRYDTIKGQLKHAVPCEISGQGNLSEASVTCFVVCTHPLWGLGHIETSHFITKCASLIEFSHSLGLILSNFIWTQSSYVANRAKNSSQDIFMDSSVDWQDHYLTLYSKHQQLQ